MGPTSISPCLTFFTFQIISCKLHLRHSNQHLRWRESLRLAGRFKVSGICPSIRDDHSVLVTIWWVCSLNLRLDVNPDYFDSCVAMIPVCVIFKCRYIRLPCILLVRLQGIYTHFSSLPMTSKGHDHSFWYEFFFESSVITIVLNCSWWQLYFNARKTFCVQFTVDWK